jgi:hypothetical protein
MGADVQSRLGTVALVALFVCHAGCTGGDVDAGPDDDGGMYQDAGVDGGDLSDAGDSDAGDIDAGDADAGDRDAGEDAGDVDAGPRFLNAFTTLDEMNAMASDDGEAKYLAPIDGLPREPPLVDDCYFQNMSITPWHQVFLMGFPETATISFQDYTSWVLRRATRKWWGGSVKLYPSAVHPITGTPPVMIYTVYSESTAASTVSVEDLVEVHARMQSCIPFASSFLAFLPTDTLQNQFVVQAASALADAGIATYTP